MNRRLYRIRYSLDVGPAARCRREQMNPRCLSRQIARVAICTAMGSTLVQLPTQ